MQCLQCTVLGLSFRLCIVMYNFTNEEHSPPYLVAGHQEDLHGGSSWEISHTVTRSDSEGSTVATEHLSPLYALERLSKPLKSFSCTVVHSWSPSVTTEGY